MTTPSPTEDHLAAHIQAGRTEGSLEQIAARLESMDATHRQDMATLHRRFETLEATHREDMANLRQDMATLHQHFEALDATHRQDMANLRQEHRRDFRWLIGIQITTLIALGTLILTRLPG